MALVDYSTSLFKYVADEVAGVPAPLFTQVARDIVKDFCERTQMWQEMVRPMDLKKGQNTYSLQPNASDREIDHIVSVFLDSTDEQIHNGTDGTWWTATADQGTWDFASATDAYEDGLSIDFTAVVDTDYATLARGYDLSMSDYDDLVMAIKLTSWASGTDEIALRWYLDGSAVGSSVNLSDYIDIENTTSWQTFVVPKADMTSPASVDTLRLTISNTPAGYLDAISLNKDPQSRLTERVPLLDYTVQKYKTIKLRARSQKDESNKLNAIVSYMPSETGTNIPEWIWKKWRYALSEGIKHRLFAMSSNTWGNLDMAMYHGNIYTNEIKRARADVNKGLMNRDLKIDLNFGRG